MNKKLLIAYALAAIIVFYIINLYRSQHDVEPKVTAIAPPTATPEIPVNQEALELRAHNDAMIEQYTQQIKSSNDTDGEAYYQRALIYLNRQQYRSAIKDLTSALQIVPDSHGALYARALAYKGGNKLDDAMNDLNAAIKLKADFTAAYNARAAIYDEQGKTDEAINDYKNAIALNPNFDQSYYNLGTIYQKQKQFSEAITEYSNAISHNSSIPNATPVELADAKKRLTQAHMTRAYVYLITDDLQAALKDVNIAISSAPKNEAAYRLRADIYSKMGNNESSIADTATADNLSMQNLLEN